jgi:LptD protein
MSEVFKIPLYKVVNFSLKAKLLRISSESVRKWTPFYFVLTFLLIVFFQIVAVAQVERPVSAPPGDLLHKKDSLGAPKTPALPKDTTHVKSDSVKNAKKKKGTIETTIFYSSRDSINSTLNPKIIKLYGAAKIKYGTIELEAEEIIIDYDSSTITAHGGIDTLGKDTGFPVFKNGSEKYETKDIVYNFKTKRAKISEVRTKQGDGIMHGKAVFKNEKNELFSLSNGYTTCDLAHPHFRIISTRAKAIPGDKMVSGPFYMEFNGVPTPVGFLFGIFPAQKKSSSGIIVPAYGEERNRGFFLRGGGYFFDISDYVKLEVKGDIYSKGSNALYINSTYKKRYAYNGLFNFSYTNNITTTNIEAPQHSKDFRLTWSHSPQTKGTGRFSASVNAATSGYNNNNYLGVNTNPSATRIDNTSRKLSSNVSYSKTFPGSPFSYGLNLRINQDLTTKEVDVPFPDFNFNVNNIYPFKKYKGSMFLQNISTRLTTTATNQITNNLGSIGKDPTIDSIAPFNMKTLPKLIQNAKKGVHSNLPLQTSFKLFHFFTFTTSITFDELMYFEKLNWGVDATGKNIAVKDTIKGFSTVTNYSGSVGFTTRIYGTKFFKKTSKIQAIRHIINPSISLNFQPDFSAPKYDYYQRFDIVNNGVTQTVFKSRYDGFIYGSSKQGQSRSMSFGVNNNIEMKVKGKADTVAKKIPLFNTLSITSGYNFAAPSFKLSPVSLAANTNVLNGKVNVNFAGQIDPYVYRIDSIDEKTGKVIEQTRIDHITLSNGLSSATFAFSTNLNPKGQSKDNTTRDKIGKSGLSDSDKKFFMDNPDAYVDFSIPWNLRINYNVNYVRTGHLTPTVTQAMRFNGDVSLSKKWKITYNSGFDFQSKQITQTQITLRRDLHCWQMSLNWVPFGKYQSYSFSIGIKSGMLRDLKLDRNRSFYDTF